MLDMSHLTPEQIEGKLMTVLAAVETTAREADDAVTRVCPWSTDQAARQSAALEAIAFELRARRYFDTYAHLTTKVAERLRP